MFEFELKVRVLFLHDLEIEFEEMIPIRTPVITMGTVQEVTVH